MLQCPPLLLPTLGLHKAALSLQFYLVFIQMNVGLTHLMFSLLNLLMMQWLLVNNTTVCGGEGAGNPQWFITPSLEWIWVFYFISADYPCPEILYAFQYSSVKQLPVIWGVCHLYFVVPNSWLLVMMLWSTCPSFTVMSFSAVVVFGCHRHKEDFRKDNKQKLTNYQDLLRTVLNGLQLNISKLPMMSA